MIDPSDTILDIARRGDAGVLPTPTGGPDMTPAVGDVEFRGEAVRMFLIRSGTLGVNAEVQVNLDDTPDYFAISNLNIATSQLSVWPSLYPAGPPLILGPGQSVGVAGVDQGVYLKSTGAVTATYNVVGIRGWPMGLGIVSS